MKPDEFIKQRILKHHVHPVTLFLGDEDYWKRLHLNKIVSDILEESSSSKEMVFFEFDASNDSIQKVIEECQSFGFFGSKKIVYFMNIHLLNKDEQIILKDYIDDHNEDTLLILETQKLDSRTVLGSHSHLKKEKVDYQISGTKDILQFIQYKLKELNMRMDDRLKNYLLEHFTSNLRSLSHNIDKMAAYNSYDEVMSFDCRKVLDIMEGEISHFDFLESLLKKDWKKIIPQKNNVFQKKDNVFMFIGLLRWQFQTLLKAKILTLKNIPFEEVMKKSKIPPFKKNYYHSLLKQIDYHALMKNYQMIALTDYHLKTGRHSENLLIDQLIYHLAS